MTSRSVTSSRGSSAAADGAVMVERLAGNAALSSEMIAEIVERTDGVPLFVEEMTKAVLEAGAERGREVVASVPGAGLGVPATLQASLMARLDRLGPAAKVVAEIGAAIGREFSYELAASVAELPAERLQEALRRLGDAGLVFQRGAPPTAEYLFKHALVQDTAYSMLLRGPRQVLHARIARALEEQFPSVAETQPEILAHHFTRGGMPIAAVDFWIKAGDLARRRSANAEAAAHLLKGLELIPALPEPKACAATELTIQNALGQIHMATKGYGSAEAEAAYTRASELCAQIDDSDQLKRVLTGLRMVNQVQGKFLAAKEGLGIPEQCRVHTASLNVFWTAGPQEIWKLTSPDAFAAAGPASARAPGWIGNAKRAAARKSTQIRWRVIAITSRVAR